MLFFPARSPSRDISIGKWKSIFFFISFYIFVLLCWEFVARDFRIILNERDTGIYDHLVFNSLKFCDVAQLDFRFHWNFMEWLAKTIIENNLISKKLLVNTTFHWKLLISFYMWFRRLFFSPLHFICDERFGRAFCVCLCLLCDEHKTKTRHGLTLMII